jgi:methionine-rich copper-binding protein CopC
MTPRPLRRSVAVALATASAFLVLLPMSVFGHAELDTMSPADKSTVALASVTEIVATFTEDLDPSGSNLALVDAAGKVVAKGGTVDATNKKQMTLDLSSTGLTEQTYTVRWTSKSAQDGDLDRGTTTFTTAAGPTTVPSPSPSAASSTEASLSASPSAPPSAAPSPSPSGGTGTSTSSTDALIPIVVVLLVIAALGLWLLRGRGRRAA